MTPGMSYGAARRAIQNALAQTAKNCLVVCDINIRQDWYTRAALEESLLAARLVKLTDDEMEEARRRVAADLASAQARSA